MRAIILSALLFFALSASAQYRKLKNDTTQEKTDLAPAAIYEYVEQMPEPGYDINEYLSGHLRYPDSAFQHNIQGRIVVKFLVNEDGSASDCKIEKGIGGGCDEEAMRVLRSMPKWKPGIHNGLPVRVSTMLPVTFTIKTAPQVYTYIEQQPTPGFDLSAYIKEHLEYPEFARKNGIEGNVMVKFVLNEDGSISDCVILRGLGGGCDEEALRLVRGMPHWKPGQQNGKPVKVYFTLPIQFKLKGAGTRSNKR